MKNILFVNDFYWPEPSAITFCLDPISEAAKKRDCSVYVFTVKKKLVQKKEEQLNGVLVHRVSIPVYALKHWSEAAYGKGKCLKFLSRAVDRIIRKRTYHYPEYYRSLFQSKITENELKKAIENKEIDTIISFSCPFSSHILVRNVLKNNPNIKVNWTAFEFDPFSYCNALPKEKTDERKKTEEAVLKQADRIIALDGIMEENFRNGFLNEIKEKIYSVPLPHLVVPEAKGSSKSIGKSDTVRLVHTGNIYTNEYLTCFADIMIRAGLKARGDFYGSGSNGISLTKDGVVLTGHGFVSEEEKKTAVENSNMLLLLGDPMPNQFPSKSMFYISTGKPILHLRVSDNDVCLKLLKKYENYISINIKEPVEEAALEALKAFVAGADGSSLDSAEIKKRMNGLLAQDVSNEILDIASGKAVTEKHTI